MTYEEARKEAEQILKGAEVPDIFWNMRYGRLKKRRPGEPGI